MATINIIDKLKGKKAETFKKSFDIAYPKNRFHKKITTENINPYYKETIFTARKKRRCKD